LCGGEDFPEEDWDQLPEELQILPDGHQREKYQSIISSYLESLILLTTTFPGREILRKNGVYLVIRKLHTEVDSDPVGLLVEKLVNVLMREEAPLQEVEDDEIVEVA
jgi:Domain of unknown function (DUF384)